MLHYQLPSYRWTIWDVISSNNKKCNTPASRSAFIRHSPLQNCLNTVHHSVTKESTGKMFRFIKYTEAMINLYIIHSLQMKFFLKQSGLNIPVADCVSVVLFSHRCFGKNWFWWHMRHCIIRRFCCVHASQKSVRVGEERLSLKENTKEVLTGIFCQIRHC